MMAQIEHILEQPQGTVQIYFGIRHITSDGNKGKKGSHSDSEQFNWKRTQTKLQIVLRVPMGLQ